MKVRDIMHTSVVTLCLRCFRDLLKMGAFKDTLS
jgi:hypothetical protein